LPKGDLNNQLRIQQQINKVLQERDKILQRQGAYISSQVKLAQELCKALDCKELDGMEERLKSIQEGLKSVAEEAAKAGDLSREATKGLGEMADAQGSVTDQISASRAATVGFVAGLYRGTKVGITQVKALAEATKRAALAFTSIGKAIISIPFKMLSGLISMSNMFSGGAPVIKQAWEEVRATFGDLAGPTGKALHKMFGDLKKGAHNLAGSGLSMRRIFGPGREGRAAGIKFLNEQVTALGPLLYQMRRELEELGGPALTVFIKGLGLSGDAFKGVATYARAAGKSIKGTFTLMTKMSKGFAKKFDMDAKTISRLVADMMMDFDHFGTLSVEKLHETAVYAHALGIEVKDLAGIIDKFLNFEDAAESAAKLQQVFGINISSFKMMELAAKGDTAAMAEHIRKATRSAGQDFASMNLAERRLMATSVGLTQENLALMMSEKNRGINLKDIKKGGDAVAKGQMTQQQATKALGKDIEKTFATGSKTFKSFADALSQGFLRGVMRGKGFRKMLRNVRKSLMATYYAGIKLGKIFVETFPGMQKVVKALTSIFDPAKFKKFLGPPGGVIGVFEKFFQDLADPAGPSAAVPKMLKRMQEQFSDFFSAQGSGASAFTEGISEMLRAGVGTILFMIPEMILGMATMVRSLVEVLTDPTAIATGANAWAITMAQMISEAFARITVALSEELWPALENLWDYLWKNHQEDLVTTLKYVFAYVFAKSIVGGLIAGMGTGSVVMAFAALKAFLTTTMRTLGATIPNIPAPPPADQTGLSRFVLSMKGISPGMIIEAVAKVSLIALALIPVLMIMSAAVAAALWTFKAMGHDSPPLLALVSLMGGMVLMSVALVQMAKAMKMIEGLGIRRWWATLGKLAILMVVMGVFAAGMIGLVKVMKVADVGLFDILNLFLVVTGGLLGVAAILTMIKGMPKATPADTAKLGMLAGMMIAFGLFGMGLSRVLADAKGKLPEYEVIKNFFLAMGLALVEIAGMIALGAALAAISAGTAGLGAAAIAVGILGVMAIFTLMVVGPLSLVGLLARGVSTLAAAGGADKAVYMVKAMMMILNGIAENLAAFAVLGGVKAMGALTGTYDKIETGVTNMGKLIELLMEAFLPPLKALMSNITFGMESDMIVVISSITSLVGAMGKMAGLGPAMIESFQGIEDVTPEQLERLIFRADKFMRTTLTGTATLVDTVLAGVRELSTADLEKAAVAGGLMKNIGEMIANMKPPDSLVSAIASSNDFLIDDTMVEKLTDLLGQYRVYMGMMLHSFRVNIPPLIKEIFKVDVPPDIAKAKERLEAIGVAMGIAGKFSQTFRGMAEVAVKVGTSKTTNVNVKGEFARVMGRYKTAMTDIRGALVEHMPPLIEMVLEIASKIRHPKDMTGKMDVIVKAMDTAAKFGTVIKKMMDLAPAAKLKEGQQAALEIVEKGRMERVADIMEGVSAMIVGKEGKSGLREISAHIMTVANETFKGMTRKEMNLAILKVKGLSDIFDASLKFTEILSDIAAIAPGLGMETQTVEAKAKLQGILTAIVDVMKGDGTPENPGLGALIGVMVEQAHAIPAGKGFGRKVKNLNALMKAIPDLVEAMIPISTMVGVAGELDDAKALGMGKLFGAMWNVIAGVPPGIGVGTFAKRLSKQPMGDVKKAADGISGSAVALSTLFLGLKGMIEVLTDAHLVNMADRIDGLATGSTDVLWSVVGLLFGPSHKGKTTELWQPEVGSLFFFARRFASGMQAARGAGVALATGLADTTAFATGMQTLMLTMAELDWNTAIKNFKTNMPANTTSVFRQADVVLFGSAAGKGGLAGLAVSAKAALDNGAFEAMKALNGTSWDVSLKTYAVDMGNVLGHLGTMDIATKIGMFGDAFSAPAVAWEVVEESLQGLINLHAILTQPGTATISGIISAVGDFVKLENEKIVVEASDKIEFNIDMRLSIDADNLAIALSQNTHPKGNKPKAENRLMKQI
jgi:hypothetical protein